MTRNWFRALLVGILSIVPLQASASFHLMKIVEIFPGTAAAPTAQYIMLQMYFPGQNLVGGHSVSVFEGGGIGLGIFTFPSNLPNGADLDTILIASSDAEALFGISADLLMTPLIPLDAGAVCYDVVDCEAWGNFSASASLPVPVGTPFNAPTGLVLGMAMHRDLSAGGSVTPFVLAPPAPKNNAGQMGTLGPTPTPAASPCVGDCDGSLQVTVDEILTMVNIALGDASVSTCEAGDANHDGLITVDEILAAVDHGLNGCPPSAGRT